MGGVNGELLNSFFKGSMLPTVICGDVFLLPMFDVKEVPICLMTVSKYGINPFLLR